MKKLGVFFIIILLISILSHLAIAQNAPNVPLADDAEKIGNLAERIPTDTDSAKDQATQARDYLKQEWGKILAKNKYIGPLIAEWNLHISPVANPVSKVLIGVEPSLSWLFVLVLTIWIIFLIYFIRVSEFLPFSKTVGHIIAIGFSLALGVLGVARMLGEKIISLLSLASTWWAQLIFVALVVLFFILLGAFSKPLAQIAEKMKEKKKEEGEETLGKLKSEEKIAETFTKPMGK